jgi:hypothetical protein
VAREALRDLIKRKAQSDALSFFASARVAFGGEATALTPQIVDLLRSLPMDQASQALADLRATVRQPLEGRTQEEHRWQLECGDLYLVIGRRDRAADLWSELTTTDNLEPELVSRATIRLCGLSLADDKPLPLAIWTPATAEDGFPEEARLLARYVTGSLVSQELKEGLRLLEAPKFFSAAEWDVARALRARAEGRLDAADRYLWSAAQKAGPDRAWPSYLLNTDQRIFQ